MQGLEEKVQVPEKKVYFPKKVYAPENQVESCSRGSL